MVLTVTKTAPGTYTYYCKITDSEGTTANTNNVTLTVMG
jgi:plastocyanin